MKKVVLKRTHYHITICKTDSWGEVAANTGSSTWHSVTPGGLGSGSGEVPAGGTQVHLRPVHAAVWQKTDSTTLQSNCAPVKNKFKNCPFLSLNFLILYIKKPTCRNHTIYNTCTHTYTFWETFSVELKDRHPRSPFMEITQKTKFSVSW